MVAAYHTDGEGFYDNESDHLPVRARELQDGAVPSGTAAACQLLLRLAGPFARTDWSDLARAELERHGALMEQAPMAAPSLLFAQLLDEHGADLAVPAGSRSAPLWAAAQRAHAPLVTRVHGAPARFPLLEGRSPGEAYLCRHGACGLPARSVAELQEQLAH
jgi:uncharacterized protein YyaL (SSP411 family)